jgi:hypothetical protein
MSRRFLSAQRNPVISPARVSAAAIALLAIGAGGCGGADDITSGNEVVEAVVDYQQGFIAEDGEAVCSSLSGEAKRKLLVELSSLDEADCAQTMDQVFSLMGDDERAQMRREQGHIEPADVQVEGDRATVQLSTDSGLVCAGVKFGAFPEPVCRRNRGR